MIKKESARASVIRNLSRFSRQQADAVPVRLREVVDSVIVKLPTPTWLAGIQLEIHDQGDATALAVFEKLQQVVLNFRSMRSKLSSISRCRDAS